MASPTSDAPSLLTVADACLVLSQRLCEWVALAPTLEEDVALANVALDILGQARGLLSHLGDEDELARRDAGEFRNPLICELPNGDFGRTMLRQLFVDAWLAEVWAALAVTAAFPDVRGVAETAVNENAYHLRHSSQWVIRLGDGTEESHDRMAAALEYLWPYRGEIADGAWYGRVGPILETATLVMPPRDAFVHRSSADGWHTEHLGYLLAEMQCLARAHPGAAW